MAQKVQVILVDDLDGGVADETVAFALDNVSYEIDLSNAHAQELRSALATWVGSARKAGRTGRSARRGRSTPGSSRATEIREWARANGYAVNDRGRISQDVQAAFDAAH